MKQRTNTATTMMMGDVHVDLSHVQDLLHLSFRCILRIKSKPLCRLNFGGIAIAYQPGDFVGVSRYNFYKAGNYLWKIILKNSSERISSFGQNVPLVIVTYKPDNKYIQ